MDKPGRLILQRTEILFIPISQRTYAYPGCKIKILFPVRIKQTDACSMLQYNWITIVSMQNILFCMFHALYTIHDNILSPFLPK